MKIWMCVVEGGSDWRVWGFQYQCDHILTSPVYSELILRRCLNTKVNDRFKAGDFALFLSLSEIKQ